MRRLLAMIFLLLAPGLAAAQVQPGNQSPFRWDYPNAYFDAGGVALPRAVPGGYKGVGTINAEGYYLNGVPLTQGGGGGGTVGPPSSNQLGGVYARSAPAHQAQTGISTTGAPIFAQLSFGDVSGTVSSAQINGVAFAIANNLSEVASKPTARANLGAAASGVNADITQLNGLNPPLATSAFTDATNPANIVGFVTSSIVKTVCATGCDFPTLAAAAAWVPRQEVLGDYTITLSLGPGDYPLASTIVGDVATWKHVKIVGAGRTATRILNTAACCSNQHAFSFQDGGGLALIDNLSLEGVGAFLEPYTWNQNTYGAAIYAVGSGVTVHVGGGFQSNRNYYGLQADDGALITCDTTPGTTVNFAGDVGFHARFGGHNICPNSSGNMTGAATLVGVNPYNTALGAVARQRVTSYTGLIGTHTAVPNTINTNQTTAGGTVCQFARDHITTMSPIVPNFYLNGSSNFAETGTGGTASIRLSVEYPKGPANQHRFLYSGGVTGSISSGSQLATDPLAIDIPEGAEYCLDYWWSNPAGVIFAQAGGSPAQQPVIDQVAGETFQIGGTSTNNPVPDHTGDGVAYTSNTNTYVGFLPIAIVGPTTKPTVAAIVDSRGAGVGENTFPADGFHLAGAVQRGFGYLGLAATPVGVGGYQLSQFIGSHANLLAVASYASIIDIEAGRNDAAAGATSSQILGYRDTVRQYFPGKTIAEETFYPDSTSNNNWATPGGQTANSFCPQLVAANNALRGGLTGVTAVIDVQAALGDSTASCLWKGATPPLTLDGVHTSPTGNTTALLSTATYPNLGFDYLAEGGTGVWDGSTATAAYNADEMSSGNGYASCQGCDVSTSRGRGFSAILGGANFVTNGRTHGNAVGGGADTGGLLFNDGAWAYGNVGDGWSSDNALVQGYSPQSFGNGTGQTGTANAANPGVGYRSINAGSLKAYGAVAAASGKAANYSGLSYRGIGSSGSCTTDPTQTDCQPPSFLTVN